MDKSADYVLPDTEHRPHQNTVYSYERNQQDATV